MPRQTKGEPGKRERGEVGEHVARIGKERKRARDDAARDFREHKDAGEEGGPSHAPFVVSVGAMGVAGVIVAM